MTSDRQWQARKLGGNLLRAAIYLVPLVASFAAGQIVARAVDRPHGWAVLGWLALVLGVSFGTLIVLERFARRLLPLATLMKLTLVFPDKAPSRMSIALRSGSVGRLKRWASTASEHEQVSEAETAETVLTLASAIGTHDRRTRGHSERVRALTDLIATELKLVPYNADRLRWGALLHDIGKITVPAEILNKPGRPDAEEWEILSKHPAEGSRLAAPLNSWLGDWVGAINQHHEKWDGSGYPNGLKGPEISLAGRIVAVADAFETMTAVRSYKKAMSMTEARAELQRCAGTHFDPAMVRAFLNISIGRLRRAMGPVAWLAQIPLLGAAVRTSAEAAAMATTSAATAGAVAGTTALVLGGTLTAVPHSTSAAASAHAAEAPPDHAAANGSILTGYEHSYGTPATEHAVAWSKTPGPAAKPPERSRPGTDRNGDGGGGGSGDPTDNDPTTDPGTDGPGNSGGDNGSSGDNNGTGADNSGDHGGGGGQGGGSGGGGGGPVGPPAPPAPPTPPPPPTPPTPPHVSIPPRPTPTLPPQAGGPNR